MAGERSKIQELHDACSMVFSGSDGDGGILLPTLDEIRGLRDLLGSVEAVDVGIDGPDDEEKVRVKTSERRTLSGREVGEITYIHIYECQDFSMGIFCLPAGAKLPLHNHPEMVVLSKVLYGSVLVRAYDWVKPPNPKDTKCGLAWVAVDDRTLRTESPATVLFPRSGGNMHSFTALTPCAILDVLSPPYSDEEGRPATYFSDVRIPNLPGFAILEERDVPEDLVVVGAQYRGPRLHLDEDDEQESCHL